MFSDAADEHLDVSVAFHFLPYPDVFLFPKHCLAVMDIQRLLMYFDMCEKQNIAK